MPTPTTTAYTTRNVHRPERGRPRPRTIEVRTQHGLITVDADEYLNVDTSPVEVRRYRATFRLGVSAAYDAEFNAYSSEHRARVMVWEMTCRLLERDGWFEHVG